MSDNSPLHGSRFAATHRLLSFHPQTLFKLIERERWLLSSGADKFPERSIGLQDDGFPVLVFYAKEHGRRFPVPRNDDTVFLGMVHTLFNLLLKISHCNGLHSISSVVFPGGFLRIARTYT